MAYDPVKAHAYYMRTRKLKGRKKGKNKMTAAQKAAKKMTKYRDWETDRKSVV